MKNWKWVLVAGLLSTHSAWAATPQSTLRIYMSSDKLDHPVLVGLAPYFNQWVPQGEIALKVVSHSLTGHFASVGTCEDGKTSDVIAWVKPRLVYNPGVGTYYATLKVQFHLGDGRPLATFKAEGRQDGAIDSVFAEDKINQAFGMAMANIESQFVNDSTLQQAIHDAVKQDFTRSPCGVVAILGRQKSED